MDQEAVILQCSQQRISDHLIYIYIYIKSFNLGLSTSLRTKGSPVQFLLGAHVWVVGQVLNGGHSRGNHTLIFLSLSFSLLPLFKKINKIFF